MKCSFVSLFVFEIASSIFSVLSLEKKQTLTV